MNESMNIRILDVRPFHPALDLIEKHMKMIKYGDSLGISLLWDVYFEVLAFTGGDSGSGMPKRRRCGHPASKKAGVFRKRSKKNHKQRTCSLFIYFFRSVWSTSSRIYMMWETKEWQMHGAVNQLSGNICWRNNINEGFSSHFAREY